MFVTEEVQGVPEISFHKNANGKTAVAVVGVEACPMSLSHRGQ